MSRPKKLSGFKTARPVDSGGCGRPAMDKTLLFSVAATLLASIAGAQPATEARGVETYGRLPLSFEANRGQTDSRVRFLSRGRDYTLFLTPTEAVLTLSSGLHRQPPASLPGEGARLPAPGREPTVLRMKFLGADPAARVGGLDELPGKTHYFIGNNPKKWRTDIPHYAKVRYQELYSGVDVLFYGTEGQLEWDFIVAPHADAGIIRLRFDGTNDLSLDQGGNLILHIPGGEITLLVPSVYQYRDGAREVIPGSYVLTPKNQVGFELGPYDRSRPLIIDPILSFGTYLGGSGQDQGLAIAVDSSGSTYVTGFTLSSDFPTVSPRQDMNDGARDVFVTKLNADGSAPLVYSTYLGGGANDTGYGIAVDNNGNAYLTGETFSTDFPIKNPAFQKNLAPAGSDAFVTKLNASGSGLVFSTYLGGTGNDRGRGISLASSDRAWVTGQAGGDDFPTTAGAFQTMFAGFSDAFIARFSTDGKSLAHSTYFGGSSIDEGLAIAVDGFDQVYVTGSTASTDFPVSFGAFDETKTNTFDTDAFVVKLGATGSRIYATYLGGSDPGVLPNDEGHGIAADGSGNAYVTGFTAAPDFPTTAGVVDETFNGDTDAFLTKLNATGSALLFSTFFGGAGGDAGNDIALDADANVHVAGTIGNDALAVKFNDTGTTLIYNLTLAGSGLDEAHGITLDGTGNAYVTGFTGSDDFSTEGTPYQPTRAGSQDAFVVKIPSGTTGTDCNGNGVLDDEDIAGGTSADCNGNGVPDECELVGNDCNGNGAPDECELVGNDCNGNGIPDDCDIAADCNGNGVPDECELIGNDCNADGIPDECEPDCNGNGIPDDCDIAGDTSNDCNANGTPDECELATNDCNGNGIPDNCDITNGTSLDCNFNGRPDECDIASGFSLDCDGNGTPDECDPCTPTPVDPAFSIVLVPNCVPCTLPNDHTSLPPGISLNANGRYVAFASRSSNMVGGDTTDVDVFVYDRETGSLLNVSANVGSQPTSANKPTLNANGRHVLFIGFSAEVPGGGVFARDRDPDGNGIFDEGNGTTTRLDVPSVGVPLSGGGHHPSTSSDGRHVAFISTANNLVPDDIVPANVFVHNRDADGNGIFDEGNGTVVQIDVSNTGEKPNDGVPLPNATPLRYISADGRYVAFASDATNLVANDTNAATDVFIRDRDPDGNGIFDEGNGTTTRVSVSSTGDQANDNSLFPALSADGRHVVFQSLADNLVLGDTVESPFAHDLFVHDRDPDGNGVLDEGNGTTVQIDVSSTGVAGDAPGSVHAMSDDGRFVAFSSGWVDMVPGKTTGFQDIFLRDRDPDGNGVFDEGNGTTTRVSLSSTGEEGDQSAVTPALSADGQTVAFASPSSNLVPVDYNNRFDVFLVNLAEGAGGVPGSGGVPGTPLSVEQAPGGELTLSPAGEITLSWGASCLTNDGDYEIYEGTLGDFASHTPLFCTTGGATTKTFLPAAGDTYYLVVPRNDDREGSYGLRSDGMERPRGLSACLIQKIGSCP